MKTPNIFVLAGLIILAGCAFQKPKLDFIFENYDNIDRSDMIDEEEAKTIAQNELFKRSLQQNFKILSPRIVSDVATVPFHNKYWFVSFDEVKRSTIPFIYMVVIHRTTGRVVFSQDYPPDKQWILETALFKLKD